MTTQATVITVFDIPTTLSDGTTAVIGDTLTAIDGARHSVTLADGQTAIFPLVVPDINGEFSITHFQAGDVVNNTPTAAFLSQTPGDLRATVPTDRKHEHASDGPSDHLQWMSGDSQGGAATIRCKVDGGNSVDLVGGQPKAIHMKAGDTWYLMFQFRDSKGKSTKGRAHGDVSVKLQQ